MKKRLLSAVLAGSMMLTMLPATAYAAEESNVAQTEQQEVTVKTQEELIAALAAAADGTVIKVTAPIQLNEDVTVNSGVTLDVGSYLLTGNVIANPGATVQIVDDEVAQAIVGEDTMNVVEGTVKIGFGEKTTTTVTEGAVAEVVGSFMDLGDDGEDYRVPKSDELVVSGTLNVKSGMEVAGDLTVNGNVNVCAPATEEGAGATLEIVKLKSGEEHGSLTVAEDANVVVENKATLDVGDYYATGKIVAQPGATVKANDSAMIGDETLAVTKGTVEVDFDAVEHALYPDDNGTCVTITKDSEAEVRGAFMSDDGSYRLPKKDELVVDGNLVTKSALTTVGKVTVNGNVTVEDGSTFTVKKMASQTDTNRLDINKETGNVTVKSGAALDIGDYYVQGNVTAEAGATVQVTSSDAAIGKQALIGKESLNIIVGAAQVEFAENTTITIPEGTTAEIAGPYMDVKNGNKDYRLPKNDKLVVEGELTVGHNLTATGVVEVSGNVTVSNDSAFTVKKMSNTATGRLDIKETGKVVVQNGTTLNVADGATLVADGEIYKSEEANISGVPEAVPVIESKVTGVSVVDGTDGYTPVTTPAVGQKLTANIQTNAGVIGSYPVNQNAKYTWHYKDSDAVLGTEPVYTVTSDNDGKILCVDVSVEGYAGSATWTAPKAVGDNSSDLPTIDEGGSSGGSGSTTYAVSVETATNGTVSVSPRNASKGATVTITVTPNEGYVLGTLTATDANGDTISLSNEGDGKYTFTMPASRVTVSATFVAESEQELPFTDVASSEWYYEAVQYVYNNELMNGMSATTFEPNSTTTRGMIVTMLYRLENEPTAASAGFTDVAAGQWYTDAVNWAAANNIVNGYGDDQFGPTDTITREQMMAILYRYAQYKGYDVTASADLSAYTDAANISSYAVSAMQWAVGEGLINGITDTTLVPGGSATRAQVAAILMRFCENVAK